MTIFNELREGLRTRSPGQTEAVGARLARALPADSAIALTGDLGTGKTTLVRGIAHGLGIQSSVTSPTYNIYTIYNGERQLLHVDAYRLSDAHDLDNLTIGEFLKSPFLLAVEWPEHVAGFLDDFETVRIRMSLLPDHGHEIRLIAG